MNELISVIIPAYNREVYIGEAIESVLMQSYRPLEIVVVNNNSSDRTPAVAATYDLVRIVDEDVQGIARARNTGVRAAAGNIIAFLDSDDRWTPNRLELQIPQLSEDCPVVFGLSQNFLDPQTASEDFPISTYFDKPIAGYAISTLLIFKTTLEDIGDFNETVEGADFIEWFARLLDSGIPLETVNEVVHHRRLHSSNFVSHRGGDHYGPIIKLILDRRRREKRAKEI